MDSTKNRKRSKLFMCFRPAGIDDGPVKSKRKGRSGDPVVAYIAVEGGRKESLVIPKVLKPRPDENSKASSEGDVSGSGHRKNELSHRSFSRALKSVRASLTKKIRNRKSRKNSSMYDSNLSAESEKFSNSMNEKYSYRQFSDSDDMFRNNSSRSSSQFSSSTTTASNSLRSSSLLSSSTTTASNSLRSSSCSSSINSNSLSERKGSSFGSNSIELLKLKQVNKESSTKNVGGYYSSTIGLCLLLICLLVLIFYGRICAIFCTSTWLFFAPRRFKGLDSPVKVFESPDIDSEEYKKKVIMEGLLDRSRSRLP